MENLSLNVVVCSVMIYLLNLCILKYSWLTTPVKSLVTQLPNFRAVGQEQSITRPDTRPPVANVWAGAVMRVFTLFDSWSRTDGRTNGPTNGPTDGQRLL